MSTASAYVFDNAGDLVAEQFTHLQGGLDPITTGRLAALGVGPGWCCLEIGGGAGHRPHGADLGPALTWWGEPGSMTATGGTGELDAYLVPGIPFPMDRTGWDGAEYWSGLVTAFTAWGWQGRLLRVGPYAADTHVDLWLHDDGARADKDVPIKELGRRLAWRVFCNHTGRGQAVAMIGHSMGGLVIRAALTGMQIGEPGFPPALDAAAAVTLATPHQGNRFAQPEILGDHAQCRDLGFHSELITWLGTSPQPARPTRWTVIGTVEDPYMDPKDTVVGMAAADKVMYQAGQGLDHMAIHHTSTGIFRLRRCSEDDPRWQDVPAGPSPVEIVWAALRCHSRAA